MQEIPGQARNDVDMKTISFTYDYVCLKPMEQMGLHEQDSWELSHVMVGSGNRLIGDTQMPFRSGDLVLIPPGIPHCWYFNSDETDSDGRISNITIIFDDTLLERIASSFPELTEMTTRLKSLSDALSISGLQGAEIIKVLKDMRMQPGEMRLASLMNILVRLGSLHETMTVGTRHKLTKEETRLNQVRIYVTCNAERQITLDDIARHLGMSRSSFCSFFKKASGQTFVNYLNDVRLERAGEMLQSTSLTVSEISAKVGFNDTPYFHRAFRRKFGVSPQLFRKGHQSQK